VAVVAQRAITLPEADLPQTRRPHSPMAAVVGLVSHDGYREEDNTYIDGTCEEHDISVEPMKGPCLVLVTE